MPWVKGRQRPTALIHDGSWSSGMFTPQKSSIRKYARLAAKKKSLARKPIEPRSIPKHVHEPTVTSKTTARAGIASSPGRKPRKSAPAPKVNTDTSRPFASTGTPRPRNTAARFAGEASKGPRVPNHRSFATAIVIPYTDDIAQTCTALPTM